MEKTMEKTMDKLGTYQILEQLHRGAQPLYRAQAKDGRIVAIKAIPLAGLSPEMRQRFMREAETCRALEHPSLIRVYDTGEADGMLFQAMELLEGADFAKVLAEGRAFTWEEKLSLMEQVCAGLEYAHARKLVHRDIKPANLFLENSGRVKVLDFGMVRLADSQLTQVGATMGTLNYMSPEQIRGEVCTAASDVFSAGIVFFQLATGRHPFSTRDRSLAQVVSAIVFEPPPKLSAICPDAPEGLEFILNKALEKTPIHRLQDAGDLKQALSLCRVTMRPGPAPASAGSPAPAAPDAVPEDDGKTRVMRRPVRPAAPLAPAAPPPPVFAPPSPPAPAAPKAPAAPAPPAAPKAPATPVATPKPAAPPAAPTVAPAPAATPPAASRKPPSVAVSAPLFRYCPSCTTANRPDAVVCVGCGLPLGGETNPTAKPTMSWALYSAIAAAVLLFIALVIVLIVKQ
jgi:eukaryotic-like serine/threonine-protein kinase